MEESEYKTTYSEIARIRCHFEKALTNNKARCSCSRHFWLADREGYACGSKGLSAKCRELLEKMRENSRFILKLQQPGQSLPHNMEIRVQVGSDFDGTGVGGRGEVTVSNGGLLGAPVVDVGRSAAGGLQPRNQ